MSKLTVKSEYAKGHKSAQLTIADYGFVWTFGYFLVKRSHSPRMFDDDRPLIAAYWQGYADYLQQFKMRYC